jgi:hypothetical protein
MNEMNITREAYRALSDCKYRTKIFFSSDSSEAYIKSCDCPLECNEIEYTKKVTTNTVEKYQSIRVWIYYNELKQIEISESPKMKLMDFGNFLGSKLKNLL